MNTTPPTLDHFYGWLSELHDATRENISAATDRKAHGAHLDSFSRTRAALALLGQFKAAHPTSRVAASAASQQSDGPVTMDKDRQMVCLEAVWEIDAIARTLPGLIAHTQDDDHSMTLMVRAMAGRMLQLTGALMSALGDEDETTEHLAYIVTLGGGQG
jgi:esterase/lipase superfamily enzyme